MQKKLLIAGCALVAKSLIGVVVLLSLPPVPIRPLWPVLLVLGTGLTGCAMVGYS